MLFNGIDLSEEMRIKDIRGRGLTGYEVELIDVPGGPGAYYAGKKIPARKIEVNADVRAENREELRKKLDKINGILSVDEPVPIIFPDEKDRIYYGIPQATGEEGEYYFKHKGTLMILCPDPYKYGEEIGPIPFVDDALTATNNGTAPAKPVIELEVTQPVTFAMVQKQLREYMMIGQAIEVDQTPFEEYERIFYSNGTSTIGWVDGSYVDGGVVTGDITSNGTRFQASSYGTGSTWHGPAKKHSLPEVISDFRLEAFIGFWNGNFADYVGRTEIYLLDVNDQSVGKLTMKDTRNDQAIAWAEARAGDFNNNKFLINEAGDVPGVWNNFFGITRLERRSNKWYAYFALVDQTTGKHHARRTATWTDTENKFTRSVAQVQVHFGQYRTNRVPAQGMYSLSVYKINTQQQGTPYIAYPGDIITFDHRQKLILINGEPRKDLKDFGASYFDLDPGKNQLLVMPENSFNTTTRYQEPYK